MSDNKLQQNFLAILNEYIKTANKNQNSRTSLKWFKRKIETLNIKTKPEDFTQTPSKFVNTPQIGKMYHYIYLPKYRETLPYYDIFPLTIPIKPYNNGYLGLNLHYLPPEERAILFNVLQDFQKNNNKGEQIIKTSYEALESLNKYKWFRPCIKRYLFPYVRSRFIEINQKEWSIAIFLPTEAFRKETKANVWKESLSKI